MLIKEAGKAANLTKKAVGYYIEQNLVSPRVLENGYREFESEDIERLQKISVLRRLGLSTDEVKMVFEDKTGNVLHKISVQKELDTQREKAKKTIIDKLCYGMSYAELNSELIAMEQSATIAERLLNAFPGYFGRVVCLHFARFLNEPMKTEEQQSAYQEIIDFLDNMESFCFPEELQNFFTENTREIGTENITWMIQQTKQSIENPEQFLSENKEFLEDYLNYRKSEEYRNSPAYSIQLNLKKFCTASGYYDRFIPAMKKISTSYADYYKQMEIANEKLILQYPDIIKLNDSF